MDAFISGAWRTARRGEVLVGGVWRRITRGEMFTGGQWRQVLSFAPPMSVAISPLTPSGSAAPVRPAPQQVTTQAIRATPAGGVGPYSYAWSVLTGGASVNNQGMATVTLTRTVPPNVTIEGSVQVTCTDAQGNSAVAQVPYYLYNYSENGGIEP